MWVMDGTDMLQSKILTAGKLKLWYLSRSSIFSPSFQNVARKILVKWSKKVRKLESYEWRNKSGLAPHFTTSDVQHKVLNTKYYKRYPYIYPMAHKIKAKIDSFMIIHTYIFNFLVNTMYRNFNFVFCFPLDQ